MVGIGVWGKVKEVTIVVVVILLIISLILDVL